MTTQRANNILAAVHRETAINVQATATGATQMRIIDSPGLQLKRAIIQSAEHRTDATKSMGRLGYKTVDGSFNSELSVGGHTDMFHEAAMRATWATSTTVGFATMTIAITTNALTATSGSFITNGVRVGDIFYLSGTTVSGNNSTNKRVVAVTTLTLTTEAAAFTTLAATVTGTLTLLKKLSTPTTPVRYSHTIEQADLDADDSELFTGCRLTSMAVSMKPGQPVTIQYGFMGADRTQLTGASSPYFSSPTLTTSLPLIPEDSTLRYNGASVATFTGLDLNLQIAANGQPVLGSLTTQDIYDNDMTLTATITGTRQDFADLVLFDAETEFDISVKLEEPNTGPPKSCFSYFLPRVKIQDLAAQLGGNGDGAKIVTLQLMIAAKAAATGYDASIMSIHSSAP